MVRERKKEGRLSCVLSSKIRRQAPPVKGTRAPGENAIKRNRKSIAQAEDWPGRLGNYRRTFPLSALIAPAVQARIERMAPSRYLERGRVIELTGTRRSEARNAIFPRRWGNLAFYLGAR